MPSSGAILNLKFHLPIPSGNEPAERRLLRVFGIGALIESVTSGRDLLYPAKLLDKRNFSIEKTPNYQMKCTKLY